MASSHQRPAAAARSYKQAVPSVVAHLPRRALLARLSAAHGRAPLTWVTGLPGSGKSSLVASWCRQSKRKVLWYRVDEGDADGAAWLDALVRTCGTARRPLPAWSPENQVELLDFAKELFAQLANRSLTLVLDDCHRLPDDAPLLTMLANVHPVFGPGLRAVLISRRGPAGPLNASRLAGGLELLDDLRLTRAEVSSLARAAGLERLPAERRRALDAADGWLAQVLTVCRRQGAAVLGGSDHDPLGDYLATEVLAALPAASRAGLRRVAELPEIPVAGSSPWLTPESVRLLGSLAAQRYFVDKVGDRFRLHDLLRDALLRLNASSDSVAQQHETRRALAGWIEASMPETAMRLRSAAGDTQGALALLRSQGTPWLTRGLHRTVLGWLSALPPPKDPATASELLLWQAQALLPLEPERARPLFAQVRTLAGPKHAERAFVAWCGEVDSYVIQWGAVIGLAELVDELEKLEQVYGPPPEALKLRCHAAALTALMYGRAEDPRIARFAELTAEAVGHTVDAGARISAAAQLLIYRMWWAGDFPGGRALYDSFDAEVADGAHLEPLPRLLWWSCAAIVDWQCGSPKACFEKVDRGLALANASGVHVRDFFLLTQGIFCALSQEDWARAEGYLARLARTERSQRRLDVMVHHFFRSWHALSRGDPRTARAHAEAAWAVADSLGSMFHKVIALSALAPALVHCGELDAADKAYREQLALAKAARNPTFSFIAFCAGAEIALARNDEAALVKQVTRMLWVKALGGFHSTCGWRTPMMRELLAFALEHELHVDVARTWIRERQIDPPQRKVPRWPLPVTIGTVGGLWVEIDSAPGARRAARPALKLRELLAVLVSRRKGATSSELTDWLWHESDGDRAASALKVAIHRLRQWLGARAVRVADGRVSLDPSVVDCDLWQMDPRTFKPEAELLSGFDAPPVRAVRAAFGQT